MSFSGQATDATEQFTRSIKLTEARLALSDVQLLPCADDGVLTMLRQWLVPVSFAWAHHASVYVEGRRNVNRLIPGLPLDLLDASPRELGTVAALEGRWCGLSIEVDGRGGREFTALVGTLEPRAGMDAEPFEWVLTAPVSFELSTTAFTTSSDEVARIHLNGDLESALELLEGIIEPTEEEFALALSRALRVRLD